MRLRASVLIKPELSILVWGVFSRFRAWKTESTRKRDLNPSLVRAKIYRGTLRPSLPIIQPMKTILKTVGVRVQVVLTVALLVACSLNVMFVCAALGL